MAIDAWLAFASVSLALLASPGPITLLAATYALSIGLARAAPMILGAVLGDLVAMSASLLGVGIVVARSPVLLSGLNLCGGCILVWLGVRTIIDARKREVISEGRQPTAARHVFWKGFALAALHPGGFVFFTSFVPQFVDAHRPFAPQAAILVATFLALGALTTASWQLAAYRMRRLLVVPGRLRMATQLGGVLLIGIGAVAIGRVVWKLS